MYVTKYVRMIYSTYIRKHTDTIYHTNNINYSLILLHPTLSTAMMAEKVSQVLTPDGEKDYNEMLEGEKQ